MATITASLERSLQNCSLNQSTTTTRSRRGGGGSGGERSSTSSFDTPESIHHYKQYHDETTEQRSHRNNHEGATHSNASSSDDNSTYVDLNSHVSLPYHWEQCLDLKSGELYYINWSTGAKAKEDPRRTATVYNVDSYSEEEDENDDEGEEESSVYDSEGSSTESSSCSSNQPRLQKEEYEQVSEDAVLVVVGCKSCLMYYMLPKHVDQCPKCSAHLLHFAANTNSSP